VLSFSISSLFAQTILVDGKPGDWPAVLNGSNAAAKTFIHDATNQNDDQFTQGSQDDNVLPTKWKWNIGSTNDKGDIQNTAVALIGSTLYFCGDRTAINGTAQIGFWFFLDDVFPKADGTFNGDHVAGNPNANPPVPGDLLILSNFVNGGGTVDIRIFMFTGYSKGKATFQQLMTSTAPAAAMVNTEPEPVPTNVTNWTYQAKGFAAGTYVTGSFFEGSVDLSRLGNLCFQQFLMETRNSAELSASQQDMAADDFDVLPSVDISVTLKTGLIKTTETSAACPEVYRLDALQTTTADITATTTATTTTWAFTYSNGNAVPATEATFTVGNPNTKTGIFEVKSADAFGKTYRLIATASNGLNCDDKDTICINVVGSPVLCAISGPNPVCPQSVNTYIYNPDGTGGADQLPNGFTAKWSLTNNTNNATPGAVDNTNSFEVTANTSCNTEYTVKLELTSQTGLGNTACSLKVDVKVNSELTLTCPGPEDVDCGESTAPSNTGNPTAPDNGCGIKLYYVDTIYRTFYVEDACGTKKKCTQRITVDTCIITNTLPGSSSSARQITTTGPVPVTQGVVNPLTDKLERPKADKPAISPATLSSISKELQVQAFPNPFSNMVNFRFVSPVSGRAILEVFNTQGQRVGIVFDGNIDAGSVRNVQFSTKLSNQALIYRLKVGNKMVRGTVLELKR
jgi:hypothetical protein